MRIGFAALLLLIATSAWAQNAGPTSRLGWDQNAGSVTEAQGLTYEALFDGSTNYVTLSGVTCTSPANASGFPCTAAFPPQMSGAHTVAVRAVNTTLQPGQRLEGPLSAIFNYVFVALPAAPTNLRVVSPAGNTKPVK